LKPLIHNSAQESAKPSSKDPTSSKSSSNKSGGRGTGKGDGSKIAPLKAALAGVILLAAIAFVGWQINSLLSGERPISAADQKAQARAEELTAEAAKIPAPPPPPPPPVSDEPPTRAPKSAAPKSQ